MRGKVVRWWVPVGLYMLAIFAVSSMQQAPLPSGVPDKPAHALAYVGLGVLVARALGHGLPPRLGAVGLVVGFAVVVAYGASDEFHQRFVPGRSAEIADLIADAIGGGAALVGCWAWGIISPRSLSPRTGDSP